MRLSLRNDEKASSASYFLATLALVSLSCSPSPPTTTVQSTVELREIANKPITIVSFSAAAELETLNGSPGAAYSGDQARTLIVMLARRQLQGLTETLSRELDLVGSTAYRNVSERIKPTQAKEIATAIKEANASFGVVSYSQFGWEWAPAKSGVAYYRYRIATSIHNEHGEVVWEAAFRVRADPRIGESFKEKLARMPGLEEFAAGVVGQAPSPSTILGYHERAFDNYPRFLLLLIEEDLAGAAHKPVYERLEKPGFFTHNISDGEWPSD